MHLLIPFAAPLAPGGRQAMRQRRWDGLRQCLSGMAETGREGGSELSFTPPHELALARALGWSGEDGRWPLAAWWAAQDGVPVAAGAWALLTPTHWHLGTEQVSLTDPAQLALDEAASRDFLAAVAPLFTSEGFELHHGRAGRWYARHDSFADLATASLDRVIGRNVDPWLGQPPRLLRRLQNEVQMLLHTHPLNLERERRGLPVVNALWFSGAGRVQPATAEAPRIDDRLRAPALIDDGSAWSDAWQRIEADLVAAPPQRLTLCGERSSVSFEARPRGWFERLRSGWRGIDVPVLLESL